MRPPFPCPRCGQDQDCIDITRFNDPEPRYIPGMPCNCPGPRCPFCHKRVDDNGCCPSHPLDCFLGWHIVPVPEIA